MIIGYNVFKLVFVANPTNILVRIYAAAWFKVNKGLFVSHWNIYIDGMQRENEMKSV